MSKLLLTNSRDKSICETVYPCIRSPVDLSSGVSDYILRVLKDYRKKGVKITLTLEPDVLQTELFK